MSSNPKGVYPYRADPTDNYYCNGLWFMTLEGAQKYANWWMATYRKYKVVYTRDEVEATKGLLEGLKQIK